MGWNFRDHERMVLAGSEGQSPSEKTAETCVRLPRLPASHKIANNAATGGNTGSNNECGKPHEMKSQPLKQGTAAALKRRLGGVVAVSQNSNTHNSTGLKRAFKVPRNI
jgi:hypothetical protein